MKVQIFTVVVGISKNKGWILKNFLKGIEKISEFVDVELNIVLSKVPNGTDWGVIEECSVTELKKTLEKTKLSYNILDEKYLEQNPKFNLVESKIYPSTGESHSKVLDKIFWYFNKKFEDDFLLLMDYDSFFIPNRIHDFLKILNFSKNEMVVFGSVEEELKVKEIYSNSEPKDYVFQFNSSGKIEKGKRSIIYLPRIHPMFILFTNKALKKLIEIDYLKLVPLQTIGIFDEMDYILYGDCGVFLLNSINKQTEVTWILKSPLDMPVYHYKGMTLKISNNEISTKDELNKIYLKLYGEDC